MGPETLHLSQVPGEAGPQIALAAEDPASGASTQKPAPHRLHQPQAAPLGEPVGAAGRGARCCHGRTQDGHFPLAEISSGKLSPTPWKETENSGVGGEGDTHQSHMEFSIFSLTPSGLGSKYRMATALM